MRSEITASELYYVDDRHKPFHHCCQFACSFLGVVPRQKDDNSSKAGPEPVHGEVQLVAYPVGLKDPKIASCQENSKDTGFSKLNKASRI